jgi:hypothetical protein
MQSFKNQRDTGLGSSMGYVDRSGFSNLRSGSYKKTKTKYMQIVKKLQNFVLPSTTNCVKLKLFLL